MRIENKSGPWSKREKDFVADNCSRLDYREIALQLQRNPETVKRYIRTNHASEFIEKAKTAEYDIQGSPVWADLERQFSREELQMFLYHWGRIITQFKDDVYPTEEMQVVDTIKLELLMNRAISQQQAVMVDIKNLETILETLKQSKMPDVTEINGIERQIAVLRAAQESLNSDFRDMLRQKNTILKEMKGTRDARIKHLESNKQNFLGLIRKMMENKQLRYKMGIEMEKMRLATKVEYERLSDWHQYEDKGIDQPLLTPENIKEENESENATS